MFDYENTINLCKDILKTEEENIVKLDKVVDILHTNINKYNWIGYYFFSKSSDELVLGPFRGKKTDHVRIPVGSGVCGQVALSKKAMIVDDVNKLDNYLSCSIFVKSEIVVPILDGDDFLGELDIDGHEYNLFNKKDQEFLENLAFWIKDIIPRY